MTRQHSPKIRILSSLTLFSAVLSVVIAFAAPAQQADTGRASEKSFAAFVLPEPKVQAASAASSQAARTAAALPAAGNPVFLPAVTYAIRGCCSSSVAVADVNGDGKPDLIAVSGVGGPNGDGLVDVLLGNGDGTFKSASTFDSGGGFPTSVVVADMNHDGKPDLVVANCGTSIGGSFCPSGSRGVVSIFLGKGDGTFQGPTTYDSGNFAAFQVAVADVNLDGRLDVLVANECADAPVCSSGGGVAVLLGNGDGTLQPASAPWGQGDLAMAIADVNADGRPDLLVLTGGSANRESVMDVMLGNGDGSFQPPLSYLVPGVLSAFGLAVADINQDGKLDVVAVGDNGNVQDKVGVLLGNGDGSFTQGASYSTGGSHASSVVVADVNGDGNLDLLVGNCALGNNLCVSADGLVGVLTGTGHGAFRNVANYDAGATGAQAVAVADLNGDGKPDLVVAHFFTNTVSVLLNQTVPFAFRTSTSLTSTLNPSVYGQKVTWTATVAPSGSITPTGIVKFTWSGYSIGSATLDSRGVATLTRSNLNADTYPLKAVYLGDTNNLSSTSAVLNQVVTEATSSATLTSSPDPSTSGQAVTFTATITSPTVKPTGPVTFSVGKTVLGTAQLSGGKAKFTTSTLAVGSTTVTATYYGDSNIAKSSASVKQAVQ